MINILLKKITYYSPLLIPIVIAAFLAILETATKIFEEIKNHRENRRNLPDDATRGDEDLPEMYRVNNVNVNLDFFKIWTKEIWNQLLYAFLTFTIWALLEISKVTCNLYGLITLTVIYLLVVISAIEVCIVIKVEKNRMAWNIVLFIGAIILLTLIRMFST